MPDLTPANAGVAPGRLREALGDIVAAIERRTPGLSVSLWLVGSAPDEAIDDGVAYTHPNRCWSSPIRSSSGDLVGALTACERRKLPVGAGARQIVEAAAWSAGVMIEQSRAGDSGADYRRLLERVPAIIYIADTGEAGRWHYVSPQIESILGFTPEEWLSDPTLWLRRLHPEDRPTILSTESLSVECGATTGAATEYRMLHRDGHVVWIRDDAMLVHDELGRFLWHGVLSDVTERKDAEAQLERRAAQQAAVARLGEHALERTTISDLMDEAAAAAATEVGVEAALVAQLAPDGESLQIRAGCGWPARMVGKATARGGHGSQAGYTVMTHAPVVVTDWQLEDRFEQSQVLCDHDVRSGVTVTIDGHDGPFGVFGVHSQVPREYSSSDVDFIQSLANVLADALERQTTEDAMQHRALHDPLTGLPNRVLFMDRLEHTLERLRRQPRSQAAVLFLDLDHFKLVNDSLGHQAGDELLAGVSARLKQAVRPTDTIARFGGDEFGLLLEEISDERDAIAMAERIASVFARPFIVEANDHFVTVSVGIALARGGDRAEGLIRDADAAMYRAKDRGRARYEMFDEMMRGRAIARLRVENDLRRAIERDELRLAYQPIVSLRRGAIVGVEALIRWDHPQRGEISPTEFIPVAEENGLIERIGRWVLETACRQAASWVRERQDSRPIEIAVNLSPVQITQRAFTELIAEVLEVSGLDAGSLSLEITENLVLEEADALRHTLQVLKHIGVRLVLDDFGTGYSSLSYLTRLPLDALKIDRAFVDGLGVKPSDSAITEAIVGMARALSLDVVGEGAETIQQVAELRRLGCSLAQGYLFSRPVSAAEITAMLRDGAPWQTGALASALGLD